MAEFKYKKSYTIWVIIAIIVISAIGRYNKIVKSENAIERQWANVESSYQRRADLIPNLVNTVKGYAEHEQETFTAVIEARSNATSVKIDPTNLNAQAIQEFQQAQSGISNALGKLMVVVERYPDLKANQNFLELQAQLEGTENRINVERNRYNTEVEKFNNYIKLFPGNIFNLIYGFEKKTSFSAQEGAEEAPVVSFE